MNLSWLPTALALAVTVSAGVLRDVSPVKQLAVRQASVFAQTTTVETVATYFQSSTTAIQSCNGQIDTISQAQVAVTTISTTVQQIQAQLPNFQECACGPLGGDSNFQITVKALFIQFQSLVDTVNLRFSSSLDLFQTCWQGFEAYFGSIHSFATGIHLNLSGLLQGVLNVNLLGKLGINLNVLGINLNLGLGLGLGLNLRD
ncbi:hypothetical protein DFH28DRAFT_1222043 [Melampsora americana]|nr:hypothetical protein DFH28DRAFT_1222043 [Melampsora americana]